MSGRPAPGFRLNAPQAMDSTFELEGEEDSPFAGMGDDVEDPSSEAFKTNNNDIDLNINNIHNIHNNRKEQTPTSSLKEQASLAPPADDLNATVTSNGPAAATNKRAFEESPEQRSRLPLRCLIFVGLLVICLLVGLIAAVAVALGGDDNNNGSGGGDQSNNQNQNNGGPAPIFQLQPTLPPQTQTPPNNASPISPTTSPTVDNRPTSEPTTMLGKIVQRGFLKCGISEAQPGFAMLNVGTKEWEGFDADMCRAVAAAIFGPTEDEDGNPITEHVEYFPVSAFERFSKLQAGEYDLLSRTTTHTMERQVLESSTSSSFAFSIPYLYNGLQFAGQMPFVECADNLTIATEECQGTRICALDGTTHVREIFEKIPNAQLVSVVESEFLYTNFIQGFCNVIAGEQFDIAETILRERGYGGDYAYGSNVHSKEPLCMVTRDEDPQWSDFVNWVLEGLLAAEEEGITARTANILRPTTVFGDGDAIYANAFRNSVGSVGNYGEIYRRNLEALLPRPSPDKINTGDSGLIYSMPFGNLGASVGDGPTLGGTLEQIRERGFLKCGISRRVIFAQFNATGQTWTGFDVDFCKALSAAVFDGVTDTIVYTDLPASERFKALQKGDVDVLSRLTTVTLSRDVLEPSTQVGFSFSQPNFYDGLTFGGIPPFAQCADRLDVTSLSCRDLLICVNQGTTFENRLKALFPERFIVPRPSGELTVEGLVAEECNVVAGGVVDVSLTSIRNTGYNGPYQTGSSRYSKDPLALVTRQDDPQWATFVYWIVSAIFYAEEEGISKTNADDMPIISLFGPLLFNMFRDAIRAVGNYGEIYEQQAQADVPRGGLNLVNDLLSGPQHYPLPGVV